MPFPVEQSKVKAGTSKIFKGVPVVVDRVIMRGPFTNCHCSPAVPHIGQPNIIAVWYS